MVTVSSLAVARILRIPRMDREEFQILLGITLYEEGVILVTRLCASEEEQRKRHRIVQARCADPRVGHDPTPAHLRTRFLRFGHTQPHLRSRPAPHHFHGSMTPHVSK